MVILFPDEEAIKLRDDVQIQCESSFPSLVLSNWLTRRLQLVVLVTVIYTSLGRPFTLYKPVAAAPEDRTHMAAFLKKVPDLVKSGAVKPNPVKLWDGGLDAVNDGLQYMRDGKNSGEKIVYRLWDGGK